MSEQPVHRVCAVCGKRHGVTYGFKHTLRRIGIIGDKAVPKCVERAMRNQEAIRTHLMKQFPLGRRRP